MGFLTDDQLTSRPRNKKGHPHGKCDLLQFGEPRLGKLRPQRRYRRGGLRRGRGRLSAVQLGEQRSDVPIAAIIGARGSRLDWSCLAARQLCRLAHRHVPRARRAPPPSHRECYGGEVNEPQMAAPQFHLMGAHQVPPTDPRQMAICEGFTYDGGISRTS
jgi:hypothetical protein